jgi:putative acetyltransferase
MKIQKIATEQDLEDVKQLFREYANFLQVDLCFQDFENELAKLPAKYAEPEGAIFLVKVDEKPAACVALWKLEEGICEMKRLYVKPEFQGLGLGKKLTLTLMEEAKNKGYKTMKLDTLKRLQSANYIYHSLGFTAIKPYNFNPEVDVVYFEKDLV